MRIQLLAALAFVVPACAGDITSPGGGGGGGGVCGDGTVDTGEQCDDGNTVAGDGCSATCQTEQVATPHVTLSVDKPTITTDLGVDNTVTVTATSEMGFAGSVTLAAAATDSTSAAISDWTNTLDQTSLTLTSGGTATATLKVSAPGDAAKLGGTITITATGAATPATATVGVTFNPVLAITIADAQGTCSYPPLATHNIKAGRQLALYNGSTSLVMVIHTNGSITGFDHEATNPGTAPGQAYINTLATAGQSDQPYCHYQGETGHLMTGNSNAGPVIQTVN